MAAPTLLIVDDYAPSRYSFRRILSPEGYRFVEAGDGASALRQLGAEVSLAIVDVNLPDMNGFELCRQIRKRFPELPVVLISASYRASEQHREWRECGAEVFIEQPVQAEALRELARRLVRSTTQP